MPLRQLRPSSAGNGLLVFTIMTLTGETLAGFKIHAKSLFSFVIFSIFIGFLRHTGSTNELTVMFPLSKTVDDFFVTHNRSLLGITGIV